MRQKKELKYKSLIQYLKKSAMKKLKRANEEEEESVAKEDQYRLLVLHRILAHARAADSCTTRRWFEARPHPLRA